MTTDFVSVLGAYWGEPALDAFLASFGIGGPPEIPPGLFSGFLQSHAKGIELTFLVEQAIDVPLRAYPEGAIVLANIRLYGPPRRAPWEPYPDPLPFGLHFGAPRDALVQHLGPPDVETAANGTLRWDTERYSLFAQMSDADGMVAFCFQLPVVKTTKPVIAR